MGAASFKNKDENSTNNDNICFGLPNYIECTICEPKKTEAPPNSQGRVRPKRGLSSGTTGRKNSDSEFKSFERDTLSEAQPTTSVPTSYALQRSKSVESLPRPARPSRRPSLSFEGRLPRDWNQEQQERLRWAVDEVSRRLKLRPPGPRAMQVVMAARSRGKRDAANEYDLRQV